MTEPTSVPFLPDLERSAARQPRVDLTVIATRRDGRLSPDQIAASGLTDGTHVFICGPRPLITIMHRGLRRRGVPLDHIHAENFAFR